MSQDQERQERIYDEILADAYGPYEQQLAWYTYLSDMLAFPFRARAPRRKRDGSQFLEEVEVLSLQEADMESDIQQVEVAPPGQDTTFWAPLEDLQDIEADEATVEAVEDWKYWKNH